MNEWTNKKKCNFYRIPGKKIIMFFIKMRQIDGGKKINLKYSKAEQIFQKTFSVFTYSNNINWKSYSKWSLFFFQLQINPFVIYISHSYFSNEKQFCQCKKKISIIIRWIEENESNQYCNDRFVIIRRL